MKVSYIAKSYSGAVKKEEAEVKNERELASQLRSEGYILTSFKQIEEQKKKNKEGAKFLDKFFGIPLKEKMIFTRNLGVMIASGLPLSRAIGSIAIQVRNKRFQEILREVQKNIQSGSTFADSLTKYPAVFNELFVNMVRVGETGGNLEEVLNILATQLEKEHELRSKIKGAMVYPAVIVLAMVGIAILMLTYILPKITSVFEDMEVTLPPTTQFVIKISDLLRDHSILVIIAFFLFAIFFQFFRRTQYGKIALSFSILHLPFIRKVTIKINSARFARIFSSLIKSGVSMVEALEIVSRTLTNYYYKESIKKASQEIQKGTELSKIIASEKKIFPILLVQMLEVGEETGKTDTVLIKLAQFYEAEISRLTKNLSSIIEPVLMILIGGAVGFFAISMLQPMYSLMENIQ